MSEDQGLLHRSIVEALEARNDDELRTILRDERAVDIADVFVLLPDEDRSHILIDILSPHKAAEIVIHLDEAVRGEVVEDLAPENISEFVSELPPDDAADMLGEMSYEESHEILEQMPDEIADRIEELLEYDEHTAGGRMNTDVVAMLDYETVGDAVTFLRQVPMEEELHHIYLVDEQGQLTGVVPLRRMVINSPETRLKAICNPDPVYVNVRDDQEEVLQVIRRYDVPTVAVVDDGQKLVGRITHDDLMDVADEEAEEDIFRVAGTDPAELDTRSVFRAARIRLTWLLPCMVGTLGTALVMILAKANVSVALFAILTPFVPMIGAMAGNSGIQTSTVVVRGFATGEFAATRLGRVFFREGRIALAMAPICGGFAWILVSLALPLLSDDAQKAAADIETKPTTVSGQSAGNSFPGTAPSVTAKNAAKVRIIPNRIAVAVGIAMTCTVLFASCMGIAFPFTFRYLGVDPAIASGPLVTTFNDILSVSIYFLIALAIAT